MRPGVACGAAWRGLWRGVWPSLACGLWLVPWHDLWRGAAWRDLWPGVNWFHLTGYYQITHLFLQFKVSAIDAIIRKRFVSA